MLKQWLKVNDVPALNQTASKWTWSDKENDLLDEAIKESMPQDATTIRYILRAELEAKYAQESEKIRSEGLATLSSLQKEIQELRETNAQM